MLTSTNNYINETDFNRLLDEIPRLSIRKWPDHDVKFLFKIAYHCALRVGELAKLKKESFDLDRRIIYLGRTKTHKNDEAVIPKDFLEELRIYLNYKDTGRLWPKLTTKRVWVWLMKLGEWLEIDALTTPQSVTGEKTKCHIFRKSKGKDYEESGMNLSIIMNIYRHDSLNTTSKYLRNTSARVKEII